MPSTIAVSPPDTEEDGRWMSQHTRFVCQARKKEPDVVLLGDSIFVYMQFTQTYKKHIEPLHCVNFSIANDKTQNVLWRIENGELDGFSPKGLLPCGRTPNKRRKKHEEINKLLTKSFFCRPDVTYLNPDWDSFVQQDGTISHRDMFDYMHPTENGYEKLCDPLLEELQNSLHTFLKTNAPNSFVDDS
ncbi:Platelet-activating factor acetylhydrolase IB subunit beta like [Schistosoma japonicum]|nr:Platelet-activating factor acetylhydrolase IB subunit beta like [Schistosoma japonicum]